LNVPPPESWWLDAFPAVPYQKAPPGADKMLTLIAYDVAEARRLRRVAEVCEDFGIRVQYSVFECHLDEPGFNSLWLVLLGEIDETEDRLVAYRLDARSAGKTLTAGTMVCSERVVCYLV
jgi:CRISPR-associated protein Cas2